MAEEENSSTRLMYYYYAAKWGTPAVLKVSAATRNLFSLDNWTKGWGRSAHVNKCLGVVRSLPFTVALRILRSKQAEYIGEDAWVGEGSEQLAIQITEDVDGIEVTPVECQRDRIILYLHGGAHICGSVASHGFYIGILFRAANARVVAINYRLAPESPFPAALDDAVVALRWVRERNPGASIAVSGDSAGGNLAFALLIKLNELREAQPSACIGISPWLLLDPDKVAEVRGAKFAGSNISLGTDIVGTLCAIGSMGWEGMSKFTEGTLHDLGAANYFQSHPASDPLVSPLLANSDVIANFPPILIHADRDEPLAADAQEMARLCGSAGVEVQLELYKDTTHCGCMIPMYAEAHEDSLRKIRTFLGKCWVRGQSSDS